MPRSRGKVPAPFPSGWIITQRSSPSRVRSAAEKSAPLTAPGRREETAPGYEGKGALFKPR